jgi:hypothetical protein
MRVSEISWSGIRAVGVELVVLLVYPLRHAHVPFLLAAEIPKLRWGEMPFAIGLFLFLTLPLPLFPLWWFEVLGDLQAARICVGWLLLVTLFGAWTTRDKGVTPLAAWTVLFCVISFLGSFFGLVEEDCIGRYC